MSFSKFGATCLAKICAIKVQEGVIEIQTVEQETVIDTSNAVLCETMNAYITEIGMIGNVTDGSIIEDSNNSDKIILRNNEWDSKIN